MSFDWHSILERCMMKHQHIVYHFHMDLMNLCVFFCGALWARSESLLAHTVFHGVVCHGSLESLLLEVHNVPQVAYNLSLEVHDKLLEAQNVFLEAHDVSLEVHDVALEVHNVEVHVDFWEVLF